MQGDFFTGRSLMFKILLIIVFVVFFFRLVYLQLIDTSLKNRSFSNALVVQTVYPARGIIHDRNGTVLAYNQPLYDVLAVSKSLSSGFDTLSFCKYLNITIRQCDSLFKRMKNRRVNRSYSPYTPQPLLRNLKQTEVVALQENLHRFEGIFLQKRYVRGYTYDFSCSHLLGTIGEVNEDDLAADKYYQVGDLIGKVGLESVYEKTLRGIKGSQILLRDSKGRIKGAYEDGKSDVDAYPGEDLTLTIDIDLQQLAEKLLNGKVGAVVAIEPHTGEILTMVSAPFYNLADMMGNTRNLSFQSLLQDTHKPLINRASYATYSPGSTFKIVQALACLQDSSITANTTYLCDGPNSTPIKCTHYHGHSISLINAIEQSCNPFFWYAFRDMLQKNGYGNHNVNFKSQYEKWRNIMLSFGLGHTFEDSDIPNQTPGNIPTISWYDKIYGRTGWKALTIRSLSIGQGEVLVTPLQLANIATIIANDGYYITPHVNKKWDLKKGFKQTNVEKEHFAVVKKGMRNVMTQGTARLFDIPDLVFCGKTGTVQNNKGKDHALFIGFAPMDDPQIAVSVILENAGFGATYAAPIASLLMEFYITRNIRNAERLNQIIQTNLIDNDE